MNFKSSQKYHDRRDERPGQTVFQIQRGSWDLKRQTDNVTEPELVGYFSLDGSRTYIPDSSNLSYFITPETQTVHFDLNQGIESVRRKPPSADNEKIDNLLKWIRSNGQADETPVAKPGKVETNFVCFRGLLTVLMCTPYQPRDGWIICASKWKGTIYLCAFKTLEEKQRNANMSADSLKFMSWGFKFEKYMLSDNPNKAPDPSQPVDEAEEFCCMFRRRIGDHKILYGAEMDGVTAKTELTDPLPLKDLKFVELKTNRTIEHVGQDRNFRKFKLLKWWAQSFLVGIDGVLCGLRDDSGIVHNLQNYSLSEMAEMSKSYWDPKRCINFCEAFLSHVSRTVVNDCDKTIYKFERMPYGDIITTELSPTSEFAFMPSSYLEET